jgi:hypothetical protein
LPEDGKQRSQNQDAFAIVRVPVVTAVLCDGAGNAQLAASRVTGLFELWLAETTLGQVLATDPWSRWVRLADSVLLGGSECTLAAAGSLPSRYRRPAWGEVEPTLVQPRMAPHDILLLLTDRAWTPLGPVRLERAARTAALTT